jgi:hypothetical protein
MSFVPSPHSNSQSPILQHAVAFLRMPWYDSKSAEQPAQHAIPDMPQAVIPLAWRDGMHGRKQKRFTTGSHQPGSSPWLESEPSSNAVTGTAAAEMPRDPQVWELVSYPLDLET